MSNVPQPRGQAYACFLAEAPELLQTIEQDLLTLKEDRSLNKVYNLMRATHTLKAMAASVDLQTIHQLAHDLEDVFNTLHNPARVIDSALEALLFRCYECLRLLLTAELNHTPLDQGQVSDQATAIFAQLQAKLGSFATQTSQLPTSVELGIDITHSIFSTVVGEGLAALESALKQPTVRPIAMVLREQSDVFLGLAEALDLKGFGEIAQTAIAALDAHPDQAMTIAQITLADLRQGQASVMEGDRIRGGAPSTTLQQLAGIHYQPIDAPKPSAVEDGAQPQQHPEQNERSDRHPSSISSSQTIRVDVERLERLTDLTGDLLSHQNRQDSAKDQLQDTLQKLRQKFQQHQQTLNKIWAQSKGDQTAATASPVDDSAANANHELSALLKTALEEIAHLDETTGQAALVHQQWSQTLKNQQQLVTTLQGDLTDARMASLESVFSRLQQVLQRLTTTYNKPAQLTVTGAEILVDKAIAEKLYDPLIHLVRNAFDHGIELPMIRRQRGKPETGQIHLFAYQQGKQIVIEVKDDGQGLAFEQIRERAIQRRLLPSAEARRRSESQLLDLLFEPGFSTASKVNELSGRGIGLDVVRSQLKALQGSITVRSAPQQGTTFILQIPLTLTATQFNAPAPTIIESLPEPTHLMAPDIPPGETLTTPSLEEIWGEGDFPAAPETNRQTAEGLPMDLAPSNLDPLPEISLKTAQLFIWLSDSRVYVLPYRYIEEHLTPKTDQIIQSQNKRFLQWREHLLRLYALSAGRDGALLTLTSPTPAAKYKPTPTLIIRQELQIVALESPITRLMVESELRVQPPDAAISSPRYLYGHTRLDNGERVPVIDAIALLNQELSSLSPPVSSMAPSPDLAPLPLANSPLLDPATPSVTAPQVRVSKGIVLVVDDSPTIRQILTVTLEEAGYQVLQAQDGQEAIEQLKHHPNLKLVICDVEMPNLDGFEFLSCYRQNPALTKVPVVMLSNWDSQEYRQMAMKLEAAAYFTKPYAKQEFLAALNRIVRQHQSLTPENL
ncbi:MAG: response regulator [Leptolyngbyaceae cyanobacterium MO_188.B28]|nr:response regulator [Leptolyngbyaceae cyanobacterium MO_188.B28]